MGYEQNIAANSTDTIIQFRSRYEIAADPAAVARHVESLIAMRSNRRDFFPAELFADPAWDILLALTLSEARNYRLTVSHLCDGIDAPATTAHRWIKTLTDAGFLLRRDDPTDKRRKFIELSTDAYAKMVAFCSSRDASKRLAS